MIRFSQGVYLLRSLLGVVALLVFLASIVSWRGGLGNAPAGRESGQDADVAQGLSLEPNALASPPSNVESPAPPPSNVEPSVSPPAKLIVIDPGHGGPNEVGSACYDTNGVARLAEKDSNLDMAWRVGPLLEARGYRVVLTREGDTRAGGLPNGSGLRGYSATRADLQARVDRANALKADLFISLHSNGSTDRRQSGVEVWYSQDRPFGDESRRLAQLIQADVLAELSAYGYQAEDRGTKDDACFRVYGGRCYHLFVLGPEREIRRGDPLPPGRSPDDYGLREGVEVIRTRATQMPAVLTELLFLTNAADAAVLTDEAGRDAIAQGIARAVETYFAEGGP